MKIYQVSGLGANQNAFKYLKFDAEHEVIYLPWLQPESHETLEHYAQRMAENIQTDEDFILMGLSFECADFYCKKPIGIAQLHENFRYNSCSQIDSPILFIV